MAEAPRKRGRPKGSGIDDGAMLAAIARLRAADPDLKPTTAIRKIGVTDPSVVRRLRDKLKDWPDITRAAQSNLLARTLSEPPKQQSIAPTIPAVKADRPARLQPKPGRSRGDVTRKQDDSPPASDPVIVPDVAQQGTATTDYQNNDHVGVDASAGTTEPGNRQQASPPIPKHSPGSPERSSPETAPPSGSSWGPAAAVLDPQLEAMRLAAEAAAAMSRLYLHCLSYANQISPLAVAMRGQAMSSQWFAAAMAGQQAALKAMAGKKD